MKEKGEREKEKNPFIDKPKELAQCPIMISLRQDFFFKKNILERSRMAETEDKPHSMNSGPRSVANLIKL